MSKAVSNKSSAPSARPSMNQMLELSTNIRAAEQTFNDFLKQAEEWDIRVDFKTDISYGDNQRDGAYFEKGPQTKRLLVKKIAVEI